MWEPLAGLLGEMQSHTGFAIVGGDFNIPFETVAGWLQQQRPEFQVLDLGPTCFAAWAKPASIDYWIVYKKLRAFDRGCGNRRRFCSHPPAHVRYP